MEIHTLSPLVLSTLFFYASSSLLPSVYLCSFFLLLIYGSLFGPFSRYRFCPPLYSLLVPLVTTLIVVFHFTF